ncbi:hypothetical protein XENORESO_003120, partial [Xenotaenia resolanae]
MDNNGTEIEKVKDLPEDTTEGVEALPQEISQVQGLLVELREGLHAALAELGELRQRDHVLEEKLQAHQTEVDDKIMGLKNSLNTFKEELNVALFHIRDMSNRQREAQRRMELLQIESNKDIIPLPHRSSSRKNSRADMVAPSEAEHICTTNQSELSVYQNFFPTLPQGESPQRSNTSTQTSTSDQEAQQQQQKPPTWEEKTNSRDQMEISNNQTEN